MKHHAFSKHTVFNISKQYLPILNKYIIACVINMYTVAMYVYKKDFCLWVAKFWKLNLARGDSKFLK